MSKNNKLLFGIGAGLVLGAAAAATAYLLYRKKQEDEFLEDLCEELEDFEESEGIVLDNLDEDCCCDCCCEDEEECCCEGDDCCCGCDEKEENDLSC